MKNTADPLIQRGKKLSYHLRHDKFYAFDEHGWREEIETLRGQSWFHHGRVARDCGH